ncbi:hypothetical protein [uncultured Cohaesibacter sp.]|uniref:hypothetical protein n=1 Tax=uncultured Cohaesibacter sp. TaxID=1002546 RepID=UPI0029C7F4BF|nr:hypothetical protein [uncultured Cohaesibacter sp.]
MTRKKRPTVDWDAVRRLCESVDRPSFAAIAKMHGISLGTLTRRRKLWTGSSEGSSEPTSRPSEHGALVKRLYHATDQQIRHLETLLKSGEAAFDEKEARMLGTIARTLEKILALQPKQEAKVPSKSRLADKSMKAEAQDGEASDGTDLDVLREDLAQRIDRLQQTAEGGVSGKPQRSGA